MKLSSLKVINETGATPIRVFSFYLGFVCLLFMVCLLRCFTRRPGLLRFLFVWADSLAGRDHPVCDHLLFHFPGMAHEQDEIASCLKSSYGLACWQDEMTPCVIIPFSTSLAKHTMQKKALNHNTFDSVEANSRHTMQKTR